MNELKDLSWLDARETLKEFPIRTSVAMQMEDAIIDGILSRCGAVAICSGKATSAPYTQKEYLADIERFVWAPTRAGRTLTETEMRLQMNYLTKLIEGSVAGVAKNATRKGIADMYAHIEVPEWLKAASRDVSESSRRNLWDVLITSLVRCRLPVWRKSVDLMMM